MGRSITCNVLLVTTDSFSYTAQTLLEMAQVRKRAIDDGKIPCHWYAQTRVGMNLINSMDVFHNISDDKVNAKLQSKRFIPCPICEEKHAIYVCPVCNSSGVTKRGYWHKWRKWQLDSIRKERNLPIKEKY